MDLLTSGPVDQWTSGAGDHWTSGPVDQWTSGPVDQWTNGPIPWRPAVKIGQKLICHLTGVICCLWPEITINEPRNENLAEN